MKKLLYKLLIFLGAMCFMGGGLMGVFSIMGICAMLWGGDVLNTALSRPPDYSHPAFWLGLVLLVPGVIIGFAGGTVARLVIQAFADWQLKGMDKSEAFSRLKHLLKDP